MEIVKKIKRRVVVDTGIRQVTGFIYLVEGERISDYLNHLYKQGNLFFPVTIEMTEETETFCLLNVSVRDKE